MWPRTEDTADPPSDANLLRTIRRLKLRLRLLRRLIRGFERLGALRETAGRKPAGKGRKIRGA